MPDSKGKACLCFHNFSKLVDDISIDILYVNFGSSLAGRMMKASSASGQLTSLVTLMISLLTAKTLI